MEMHGNICAVGKLVRSAYVVIRNSYENVSHNNYNLSIWTWLNMVGELRFLIKATFNVFPQPVMNGHLSYMTT